MTKKRAGQAKDAWRWPLDLEQYDRTPALTVDELDALTALSGGSVAQVAREHTEDSVRLERLIKPIHDAAALVLPTNEVWERRCILILLEEMRTRGTSYWAWTSDEWDEILNGASESTRDIQNFRPKGYQRHLFLISYLLRKHIHLSSIVDLDQNVVARKIFGRERVDAAVKQLVEQLMSQGRTEATANWYCTLAISYILLIARSPRLADSTVEILEMIVLDPFPSRIQSSCMIVARALLNLGIIDRLPTRQIREGRQKDLPSDPNVSKEWQEWWRLWHAKATLVPKTKHHYFTYGLKIGRWLAEHHPDITSPEQWTRELNADFIAAIQTWTLGKYTGERHLDRDKIGKPLRPASVAMHITAMRAFFIDLQEWELIPQRFNALVALRIPTTLARKIGPDPRVIDDKIWAKLVTAGVNLAEEDLPRPLGGEGTWYPLLLVRAVAFVWLFCGLRVNEIRRLPVGCIRWQHNDLVDIDEEHTIPADADCLLDVPVSKTDTAFTKPVEHVVGEAINAWERVRPEQPQRLDRKTGKMIDYLFSYGGQSIGKYYVNQTLIPLLCEKAGVPQRDARGKITSHRGRSTIADQLYNAAEPLTLAHLQAWLGHRSPTSTQHYARVRPTKLIESFRKTTKSASHQIRLLVDKEVINTGAAAQGVPWRYYDLGHGFCAHGYFEACPHRMACARCDFYRPAEEIKSQAAAFPGRLIELQQDINLSAGEIAAIDGDLDATQRLIDGLVDVPTPAGPTPRELHQRKKPGALAS